MVKLIGQHSSINRKRQKSIMATYKTLENHPRKGAEIRRFQLPVNLPDTAEISHSFGAKWENRPNIYLGSAVFWKTFRRAPLASAFGGKGLIRKAAEMRGSSNYAERNAGRTKGEAGRVAPEFHRAVRHG